MNTGTERRVKGKATFRCAAVLFVVSALLELLGIASGATLFGAHRSGVIGGAYHLTYAGLYFILGLGLWRGTGWGYRLVFAVTLLYTLDRLQYVLYRGAMLSQMSASLGRHRELLQAVDQPLLLNVLTAVTLLFVACWWGFAGYTYLRRAYFAPGDARQNEN